MDNKGNENEDVEIISTKDERIKLIGEILGNNSSRKILNLLNSNKEMTVNEIAQKTNLSISLVIHHLKKLKSVQLVKINRVGKSVKGQKMNFYSPTNQSILIVPSEKPLDSITDSLKKLSKFFAVGLAGIVSWMVLRSSEPVPEPEPEPDPSCGPGTELVDGVCQVKEVEEPIDADGTIWSSLSESDGSFESLMISILIPVGIIIGGLILERLLTRWYQRRKLEKKLESILD